jgi:hypothetical protein
MIKLPFHGFEIEIKQLIHEIRYSFLLKELMMGVIKPVIQFISHSFIAKITEKHVGLIKSIHFV